MIPEIPTGPRPLTSLDAMWEEFRNRAGFCKGMGHNDLAATRTIFLAACGWFFTAFESAMAAAPDEQSRQMLRRNIAMEIQAFYT